MKTLAKLPHILGISLLFALRADAERKDIPYILLCRNRLNLIYTDMENETDSMCTHKDVEIDECMCERESEEPGECKLESECRNWRYSCGWRAN